MIARLWRMRRFAFLSLPVALVFCTHDPGLTFRGALSLDAGSAQSEFRFDRPISLAAMPETAGETTGSCRWRGNGLARTYTVELGRTSTPDTPGLIVRVSQAVNGEGLRVDVNFLEDDYSLQPGGVCDLALTASGGRAELAGSCDLVAGTAMSTLSAQLTVEGCRIEGA